MFAFGERRRPDRREDHAARTLLLLDQLERAQLYLSSGVDLGTGDREVDRAVRELERELAALIQTVRRIRVL